MINKRLYGLFCCLHRQMSRNSHKLFKENNLSHVQMCAMIFVECENKEGRRVCQKDIENHINLRPSATSSMLANLEKKGFITRTVSDGDARAKFVTLTEKGTVVCQKNKQFMDESDNLIQSALSEDEQNEFKNLILKIMCEAEKYGRELKND